MLEFFHRRASPLVFVLALSCTKAEPAKVAEPSAFEADDPRERESPKPVGTGEPVAVPNHHLFADVVLQAPPAEVAASLAHAWCVAGGDVFSPPGEDQNDGRFPLDSCDEVTYELAHPIEKGETRASIIVLEASVWESRELLLLQSSEGASLITMQHTLEDQSGEAPSFDRDYESVELEDVFGGPEPEWVAIESGHEGDNFEADRCYAETSDWKILYLCSDEAPHERGTHGCFGVTISSVSTIQPRPAEDLYDCDTPPKRLEPKTVRGFDLEPQLKHGEVVLRPVTSTKFDEKEEPPHVGTVSMATLFAEEALVE